MNLMIYFILLSLYSFNTTTSNKWVVTGSSTLEILGSTNINKFRCLSTNYHGGDTLVESFNKATGYTTLNGQVKLRTSEFDCGQKLITSDLQKTLKAENFPEVQIKFLELKENKDGKSYVGILQITIAGVSKRYPVTCTVQPVNAREKYFVGTNQFELSDFNLNPPEKFFGSIKVDNKVSVNFRFQLEAV